MAPEGMPRPSVMGGGDCRTLSPGTKLFRSSDVPGGVGWFDATFSLLEIEAMDEGDLRCLVRYEADRGSVGRPFVSELLRLALGDPAAVVGGDDLEGGV